MADTELEQLYQKHRKLIRTVAATAAKTFSYSDIEELCGVGVLRLLIIHKPRR